MQRLRTFLSALRPTRLGVLFAVLIGLGVGFWQWGRPPRPRVVLEFPVGPSYSFSPDGRSLATIITTSDAWSLSLWDGYSGQKKFNLLCDDHPAAVAFSPDGQTLAYSSHGKISVCELASGREVATYEDRNWVPWYLAFSPKGKLLAVRRDFVLCEVANKKLISNLRGTDEENIIRGGPSILALQKGNLIKVWDLATATLWVNREDIPNITEVTEVKMSSDRRFLVCLRGGWGAHDVFLFDLESGRKQSFPPANMGSAGTALAPDSRTLAWARFGSFTPQQKSSWWKWFNDLLRIQEESFSGKNVILNDFPSGEEIIVLRNCESPLFSSDGKTLAVMSMDEETPQTVPGRSSLQLWDLPIRKPIGKIVGLAGLAAFATLLAFNGLGWLRRRRSRKSVASIPS